MVRHGRRVHRFFPKYDRRTMSARDYRDKFAAYYASWASERVERDSDGFPTVLVVTVDKAAEERIARAARASRVGQGATLPLLLTCRWRVDDACHRHGLLGPIWRTPATEFQDCRVWPLESSGGGRRASIGGLPRRPGR
jgi:hypothetical protein